MAYDANTVAASSVTSSSFKANGEWYQSNPLCCTAPPCGNARRFYWGSSNPPGTLKSAGTVCDASYCDGAYRSYSSTISGLLSDTTYYFRASVTSGGGSCASCGGGCTGSNNGDVASVQTCAETITFSDVSNDTPGETSVTVSVSFTPLVRESTASVKAQYKLDTEPTVWTDVTPSQSANNYGSVTRNFTITGLTAGTLYDYRFVVTRSGTSCGTANATSTEGAFTTASSSQAANMSETESAVDAFSMTVTGQAVAEADVLGFVEDVDLHISSTADEVYAGVWFYHLPTRSYWFWTLDNFTAAINDTDPDDVYRLFVALGSEVYVADDDAYFYDDRNQTQPLADQDETEIPLSLVPRAVDLQGKYGRLAGVDVKWGGQPVHADPYGSVDISVMTDVYPKRPTPPDARRVWGTRRVRIAPDRGGLDEWRRYAMPRTGASNVVSARFSFPVGLTPHRRNPITIQSLRYTVLQNAIRRRRM